MVPREACPQCGSTWYKRNGHIHTGKQNHRCKLCGRAFVLNPENQVITEEQRTLIERLLLERISLRRICRAVGVGLQWLLQFMGERFQAAPEHLYAEPPGGTPAVSLQRLEAELDELWSFVGQGEPAVGLDCHGCYDSPSHCLPRRGPQWPKRQNPVGEDSHRVSGAGHILHGSICSLHRDHSLRPTPRHL